MHLHTSTKTKAILVVGLTSGIGREIARLLAERGGCVFGTVRDPQTASPTHGDEIVRMDVTDDASVNEPVRSVVEKAGPVQSRANNTGYALSGALEETSAPRAPRKHGIEEARQQFDTNFFGALRVTSAVLPGMRPDGSGPIVNISSELGFLPSPFMGIYAASKHALEEYTETMDHEVRRFGVPALLVEPAFTKSRISHSGKDAAIALKDYAVGMFNKSFRKQFQLD